MLYPGERMEVWTENRPSTRGRSKSDTWHNHPAGGPQHVKTGRVGALSEKRKGLIHKGERTKSPQEPSSFLPSNLWALSFSPTHHTGQLLSWGRGDAGAVLLQGP